MANETTDKEIKKAIKKAQKSMQEVKEQDGNEAETRRRVERIFENVLGYKIQNLSREHAVKGVGNTEHLDFAVKLRPENDKVSMVVELKRVGIDLSPKHLKQASRYAIDLGCEWALLTNGRQWALHHIEFGQPPDIKLVKSWDILSGEMADLIENFQSISYRSLKRGVLKTLWQKYSTLKPESLLFHLLSENSLKKIRHSIRKESGISVHPEEIVSAFRRLLNENTSRLIDSVKVSYPSSGGRKDQQATFNREYWESKSSAQIVSIADRILEFAKQLDPALNLNFTKFYIGLEKEGKPNNFMSFTPQKKRMKWRLVLDKSSEIYSRLKSKGLINAFNRYGHPLVFILPEASEKHASLFREAVKQAYENSKK